MCADVSQSRFVAGSSHSAGSGTMVETSPAVRYRGTHRSWSFTIFAGGRRIQAAVAGGHPSSSLPPTGNAWMSRRPCTTLPLRITMDLRRTTNSCNRCRHRDATCRLTSPESTLRPAQSTRVNCLKSGLRAGRVSQRARCGHHWPGAKWHRNWLPAEFAAGRVDAKGTLTSHRDFRR